MILRGFIVLYLGDGFMHGVEFGEFREAIFGYLFLVMLGVPNKPYT